MRVFEVMTRAVQTVTSTLSAAEARELMRRKRCHHLVVTNHGMISGVLSERDFKSPAPAVRSSRTVADLMTAPVVTVAPNDTIRSVANVMRGRSIGCVPVVERGKLAGIVTISDLLRTLGGGVERPAGRSRHTLNYRVPHRKSRRATW